MAVTIKDAGIDVQIVRETRSPSQKGFGALAFMTKVATVTDIIKLYTSLEGVSDDYTSSDEAYKAALIFYSQSPVPSDFYVIQAIDGDPVADTLDAAVAIDPDFYALALEKSYRDVEADILAASAWVEANERLHFNTSNDDDILNVGVSSDIASQLQTLGYNRTYTQYSSVVDQYPAIAAFAILATTSFRGTDTLKTLKFKDLTGITSESIDGTQLNAIKGKNCNVLYTTASIRMVDSGIMASGSWIDEIHGTDALAEQIRVNVFGALARTSTKIPYTERGMSQLKYQVESALEQYVRNGFLATAVDDDGDFLEAYTVTSGLVADAPTADKSARIAPDIEFTARLAGAVHSVLINGTLTL